MQINKHSQYYLKSLGCCLAISTARSVFPTNGDTKALTRHCHDALSVSSQRDIIVFLQSSTFPLLSRSIISN